ncbi:hypothetical protein [Chelativorans sp. AA-79]|uniref:hypothetical protein n=1 Tax=Chelativorans sp. AA-79 TaxID=3028735 RepID=UPI0023F9CE5B|nr:hypothetical protein [Chelativorans sp. AA-79]WEX08990.1 hypothetical protein PVE73_23535 [Chelativorans sp. AA-79]
MAPLRSFSLCVALVLSALAPAMPAAALEPEQREATIISVRVWEGHEYREVFIPSTSDEMSLIAGRDSAIAYVRTLEYYWPLSRRIYVDFQRQRDLLEGELVIRQDGEEIARESLRPFSILYPEGAAVGEAELLWGEEAERAYAEHREAERAFAREFAAARRAHTAYERRLLQSGAARQPGEEAEVIDPPPPLPEPSLRLVMPPQPGFRASLDAGTYTIALERDGQIVPDTLRRLRVASPPKNSVLVADIVPAERWTRPLAANTSDARVYARPGATFYLTLAEANQYAETDYLPVVRPQAEPVAGRTIWIRRGPASVDQLDIQWQADGNETLAREALKVEQTRGTSFGYRVRAAREGEVPDLNAFTVTVPADSSISRGVITREAGALLPLRREVVVVQPRNTATGLILALVPLAGFLAFAAFGKTAHLPHRYQ